MSNLQQHMDQHGHQRPPEWVADYTRPGIVTFDVTIRREDDHLWAFCRYCELHPDDEDYTGFDLRSITGGQPTELQVRDAADQHAAEHLKAGDVGSLHDATDLRLRAEVL